VNLAVLDEFRQKGLATELLKVAENWGQRLGVSVSLLEVRESAFPAHALYAKGNYFRTRVLPKYYPDGEDGLELQKTLRPDIVSSSIAHRILRKCSTIPRVGIILGSGLSWLSDKFENSVEITYRDLYGDSEPEVAGHPEKLVFSRCGQFVFMLGRRHHYQGYSGDDISLLPSVLGDLGVTVWILTSSSGAVDADLTPGDAVLFRDHVNFSGCIPEKAEGRVRRAVYSSSLKAAAEAAARSVGIELKEGIFACVSGPAYETSADIKFLQRNGFSTVSMSTAPEALLLSSRGFEVAALSLVTNAAEPGAVITHEEVLASQGEIRAKQGDFLDSFIRKAASVGLQ